MTNLKDVQQSFQSIDLSPEKGLVNIGSHPENDVVIPSRDVVPFHLMIDYRQQPYHLIPLDPNAQIMVDGSRVSGLSPVELSAGEQIQLGDTTLVIRDNDSGNAADSIAITSTGALVASAPGMDLPELHEEAGSITTSPATGTFSSALPYQTTADAVSSDAIVLELEEIQTTVDVNQTAVYLLTVINGGPIVAQFSVEVDGVPQEWVKINNSRLNLNEGSRRQSEIQITPPRESTSRAGGHPVRFRVTSSNYPGEISIAPANLTINPYYEYSVTNLSPSRKSVPWRKRAMRTQFAIQNQGNSPNRYLVSGQDDENGCNFEIRTEEGVNLSKQAEISVEAGESKFVPVTIAPLKRSLVRMRGRQYHFMVNTQSMDNVASTRMLAGSMISRPLVGMFGLFLIAVLLAVAGFFVLRPRITEFSVSDDVVDMGEPVMLRWKASLFTTDLWIEGSPEELSRGQNQLEVIPSETATTYTLVGANWLSRMLQLQDVRSQPISVLAIPPQSEITTFVVNGNNVFEGDAVNVKWSVNNADTVYLTVDGVTETLTGDGLNGEKDFVLRNDTLIVLEAKNISGSILRSHFVNTKKPTIEIKEFSLSATEIYRGDPVTIIWDVAGVGVESVFIAPFTDALPLSGELTFYPEESMEFVMSITNRDLEEIRLLPVGVLDPEADPAPPTIDFFTAAPDALKEPGKVELAWSVSGVTTNVEIIAGEKKIAEGLPAQGFKQISVGTSGTYILTAFNGDLSTGKDLKITVDPALKNLTINIHEIYPTTNLETGDSVTVSIETIKEADEDPPATGEVVVTDGTSSCSIELPNTSCVLPLQTPGDKSIWAIYHGDDKYVQSESDPYPTTLFVDGQDVTLEAKFVPQKAVYRYGEPVEIEIRLVDINMNQIPDGQLRVFEEVCDPGCYQRVIGFTELKPEDTGEYTFKIEHLRGVGEPMPKHLRISFTNDSFYDPLEVTKDITIDPNSTSPTQIIMNPAVTEITLGDKAQVNLKVRDDNEFELYTYPEGDLVVNASGPGGRTIGCIDDSGSTSLELIGDSSDPDKRFAVTSCNFKPTIEGLWTLTAEYYPSDLTHKGTTQIDEAESVKQVTVKAPVTMSFLDPLAYNAIYFSTVNFRVSVEDVLGNDVTATDGELTYRYSDGVTEKSGECTYDANGEWDCDVTFELHGAVDLIIAFTPADEYTAYSEMDPHPVTVINASTVVGFSYSPPYASRGYAYSGDVFILRAWVNNIDGGDPPTSGTINVQFGAGNENSCDPANGFLGTLDDSCTITLDGSNKGECEMSISSAMNWLTVRSCAQYDGAPYYDPSEWTDYDKDFWVYGLLDVSDVADMSIVASQIDNTTYRKTTQFSVTYSNDFWIGWGTSYWTDQLAPQYAMVLDQNDKTICPSPANADIYCKQVSSSKNDHSMTVTWAIGAENYQNLDLTPVYDGDEDGNRFPYRFVRGNPFDFLSRFDMTWAGSPTLGASSLTTYTQYDVNNPTNISAYSSNVVPSNTTLTGSFSYANFGSYDLSSIGDVIVKGTYEDGTVAVLKGVVCTKTDSGTGSVNVSCPIRPNTSTLQSLYLDLSASTSHYVQDALNSPSRSVTVKENVITPNTNDGNYGLYLNQKCQNANFLDFTITGHTTNQIQGADTLDAGEMAVLLYCNLCTTDGEGIKTCTWTNTAKVNTDAKIGTISWQDSTLDRFIFSVSVADCADNSEDIKVQVIHDINNTHVSDTDSTPDDYEKFYWEFEPTGTGVCN
jgi:hypothetical protein